MVRVVWCQYAENGPRINEMWPAYESALKAAGARYNEGRAKLAWDRTVAFFKKNLA